MDREVLRVTDITKSYRPPKLRANTKVALKGLHLEAYAGEVLGLVGPNGAGKTTLFRILMGLLRADGGSGHVFGHPLGARPARRRMGYLPERFSFYPRITVLEVLRLSADLCGLFGVKGRRRASEWVERMGLSSVASSALGTLSKGWLQRVGLAQAMLGDPHILVLDEPLSGLDPLGRAQVKEFIAGLAAEGRTVLLSSHILPDVEVLAHRVAFISEGRIVETMTMSRLMSEIPGDMEILVLPGKELAPPPKGRLLGRSPDGWERWGFEGLEEHELERILRTLLGQGVRVASVQPRGCALEEKLLKRFGERTRRAA
jgi:ABC-2 type transport system ATP-binding protein